MEKYENIMKLIDESIAKYESDVKWYREHYHQATEEVANLTKANEVLKKENEELKELCNEYEGQIDRLEGKFGGN